jgi:hypothetical protein
VKPFFRHPINSDNDVAAGFAPMVMKPALPTEPTA